MKTKKKLLFIMRNFEGGGAERVTIDIIKNLDNNKFEPIIFVINYQGELISSIPKHVKIIKVLTANKKGIFHLFKLIKSIKKAVKNADLIIGTLEATPTYLAAIASYLTNKPAIGWVHIDVEHYSKTNKKIHKYLINKLYRKLKTIIAVSDGVKASFEKKFPKVNVPIKRIYNPIRLNDISSMLVEKNDLDVTAESILLGVGRLTEMKGFDDLIKAHKYLLDKKVKTKLIILGEGEQRENLEKLILELNVQESVILKGFVNNPYKYMKAADVFVLSSRYEGFSVVIAEALAVGLPVVSTNCPSGPSEVLEEGKYGLLSPVNDYKALAMNIIESLKIDNDGVKNIRKKRANDFSFHKIMPEFEELFHEIVEKNSI